MRAARMPVTFRPWTMTPSSAVLLIVLGNCQEWRRCLSAGHALRAPIGRTATGISRSITERTLTRRHCVTSAGRVRFPRSAAGARGVFNGGAWLTIDGRRADVHYRDLDTIDREIAASREGRFRIEPRPGAPEFL
jgi:hypothetical protein